MRPLQDDEKMTEREAHQEGLVVGWYLVRNVIWNLLGTGLPPLVGLVAVPVILQRMGVDRFGVLTITWAVLGYFSVFDFGVGRALTKLVAEALGRGDTETIPSLIWAAIGLVALLGLVGMVVLLLVAPWIIEDLLKIPLETRAEAIDAFKLLAFSIPFIIGTTALRGILEAYQRFDLVNAVRIPTGMLTFLGPLLVLPFSNSLAHVVAIMAAGRAAAWFVFGALCIRLVPELTKKIRLNGGRLKELLRFGGWLAVTNLVGPVMIYMDRFFIGAIISIDAVAYYATPFEFVTRLLLVPAALVGVAYPAFSTTMVNEPDKAAQLLWKSVNYIFFVLFPVTLVIVAFAHDAMSFWLGQSFAEKSSLVVQWLAAGILLNSLAHPPFAFVQGAGYPQFSAGAHLFELPFYLLILWWLLSRLGIEGAAIAWTLRVALDGVIFFMLAKKLLPGNGRKLTSITIMTSLAMIAFVIVAGINDSSTKLVFVSCVLILTFLLEWRILLTPGEKQYIEKVCRIKANWPLSRRGTGNGKKT